jgi:hypothetical protein
MLVSELNTFTLDLLKKKKKPIMSNKMEAAEKGVHPRIGCLISSFFSQK